MLASCPYRTAPEIVWVSDRLWLDVGARGHCQVVAGFDGYVLTTDLDITVGGIDGNACECIDVHGTER